MYIYIYIHVKLYIRESLFVERMHQKKANAETLWKIWFVLFVSFCPVIT